MDQAHALRMLAARGKKEEGVLVTEVRKQARVIAVTSGKGGVGKTNIVANLAYILTKRKKKSLILDADLGLANIDVILGLMPRENLCHVIRGERSITDVMIQGPGGIKILPSASGIPEMVELTKGQKLTLVEEIKGIKDEFAFLLIDTGAGIASNVMYFNAAASELIVVTTPEPTSLTDAYALIKVLFQRYAKKRFMLLVNMVKNAQQGRDVYARLNRATDRFLNLSIEYLGHIVHDENLPEAVRQQQALMKLYPRSPASRCLEDVAEKLCREEPDLDETGGESLLGKVL